jgi:hypothetical protein
MHETCIRNFGQFQQTSDTRLKFVIQQFQKKSAESTKNISKLRKIYTEDY